MARSETSIPASTEGSRFPGWLDPDRFHGLVVIVVGLSQVPVALAFPPERSSLTFVVGSAGMLLVAIGGNLLRGSAPFESGWHEDGVPGPVSVAVLTVVTVAVAAASVLSFLP